MNPATKDNTGPLSPVFARVVIERDTIQQKTSLIIPAQAAERNAPAMGTVLAIGPNVDEAIWPGQRVIFGQHAGTKLTHGGKDYFVCNDEDIICEIKDERERKAA